MVKPTIPEGIFTKNAQDTYPWYEFQKWPITIFQQGKK